MHFGRRGSLNGEYTSIQPFVSVLYQRYLTSAIIARVRLSQWTATIALSAIIAVDCDNRTALRLWKHLAGRRPENFEDFRLQGLTTIYSDP